MFTCDIQPCDVGYCCQFCEWTGKKPIKRNCPARERIRGFGDIVARVAHAVGVKKCGGCARRQKEWNAARIGD